jgi:hypothetical protein
LKTSFKRLGFALMMLIIALTIFPGLVLVPWTLAFGWVGSLRRLLTDLAPVSGVPIMALIGLLILVIGTHWFCAWLHQGLQPADFVDGANAPGWPWKWTLALHGGLWLVFFAVMGLVGIVHQVAWMAASGEPVFVSRTGRIKARIGLINAVATLRLAGEEAGWNLAKTQASFWNTNSSGSRLGGPIWEGHQVIFLPDNGDRLAATIVIPRDPRGREQVGFAIVQPEGEVKYHRGTMLAEVLARYENTAHSPP